MSDYNQPAPPPYGQAPEFGQQYGQAPEFGQQHGQPQYGQAPEYGQPQYPPGSEYGQPQFAQAAYVQAQPQQFGQYGQYPQYGPPAGQYAAPARTNPVAIAALICGCVQFIFGIFSLNILLAIPAVICGAIGMKQVRQRNEQGKGLAIAGLVLGILGIVYFIIVVLVIAWLIHNANNINNGYDQNGG
jgi:Domain of unknown function (DUF4190)